MEILDAYFESRPGFTVDPMLEKAIGIIEKNEGNQTVSDVSEAVGTSAKTLNRKFLKYLDCSVKDYLEVHRFRQSFNHFLSGGQVEKLTELAHQFNYYDQSDFIRKFRRLTGINPKKVFQSVEHFGSEELFWGK